MDKRQYWKEMFDKRASNTNVWLGILIIALFAYFIWQSKIALFATLCSIFFFLKNIVMAYLAYRKKEVKDDK